MKYQDDENDMITISCDLELITYFSLTEDRQRQKKPLRVILEKVQQEMETASTTVHIPSLIFPFSSNGPRNADLLLPSASALITSDSAFSSDSSLSSEDFGKDQSSYFS